MTRLALALFAAALAVTFSACEGHSVDDLPPHYQHKLHHGDDKRHPDAKHPDEKHPGTEKDPNQPHKDATAPAGSAAHPGENPVKKH